MLEDIMKQMDKVSGKKIVSIIGAGGKSTLMYALAHSYAKKENNVFVTTTTHIYDPMDDSKVNNLEELHKKWGENQYALAGVETKGNKLKALSKFVLEEYMKEADVVLIEADGAKGLPCKVSNTTEPVLIEETNIVIMVLGLDALGKRMRNVCFRCELAMDLLGEDRNHVMKEEDFVTIIRNQMEQELNTEDKMCIVVLNKCDYKKQELLGKRIAKVLEQDEKYKVFLTSFL